MRIRNLIAKNVLKIVIPCITSQTSLRLGCSLTAVFGCCVTKTNVSLLQHDARSEVCVSSRWHLTKKNSGFYPPIDTTKDKRTHG